MARATVCKGRDSRGRIKRGYRLTRGGLVKVGASRRRKKPAAKRRRAAPASAGLTALIRRARKVAARNSPGQLALKRRAAKVRARYAAPVVSIVPADRSKPPAPSRSRQLRLKGTRKRRQPRQAAFKF